MKTIIKKLLTVMFALVLFVSMASHNTFAAEDGAEFGSASLTITNLNPGDQFRVWKIVKILYNQSKNTLVYEFTPASKDYFDKSEVNISIEDFMVMVDDSEKLIEAVAGLSSDIFNNNSQKWVKPWTNLNSVTGASAIDTDNGIITVGADGEVSIAGLSAGGYYIEPYKSDVVYQPMFVPIIPKAKADQSGYECVNVTFSAKHTSVSATKYVKRHGSTSYGEEAILSLAAVDSNENYNIVDFKTVVAIPRYVYGSYNVLEVSEVLPIGLSYIDNSLDIKGLTENNGEGHKITNLDVSSTLSKINNSNDTTLKINLKDQYNLLGGYQYLQITYQAIVNDNEIAQKVENALKFSEAKSSYTYSAYPYLNDVANVTLEAKSVKLYTYGIQINKEDKFDSSKKLQNAKFKLYRAADSSDINLTLKDGSTIPVQEVANVGYDIVTDSNGIYKLKGISSDATYYLVETSAPAGYKLDSTPIKLEYDHLNDAGYYEITIGNSSQTLSLPTTGATGMVAFTVCGLAVMAAAIVILVKTRESH